MSPQQRKGGGADRIQRAMKFEFQVKKNKIYGWDGGTDTWSLPRKFGPADFIHKGGSGVRLESETNGQIEFETGWKRKHKSMSAQVLEAMEMVRKIDDPKNDVKIAGETFKRLPFNIDNLRKGEWKAPKGKRFENNSFTDELGVKHSDKALDPTQSLVVKINDPDWRAYIQTSESMEMNQYESFLRQHEFDSYDPSTVRKDADGKPEKVKKTREKTPWNVAHMVTALADEIIADVTASKPPKGDISDLRGFLQLVVHKVIRGQYPASSPILKPTKYSFSLMSRTHLGSIYSDVLKPEERRLFRRFVARANRLLLKELKLARNDRLFVHGQGSKGNKGANPKIISWLQGLASGSDSISSRQSGRVSGAMGRHRVGREAGKHKGLVRLEVRMTPGNSADAKNWDKFVKQQYERAIALRPRPDGKGETGLKM